MTFESELKEKTNYYTQKGIKKKLEGEELIEFVRSKVYKWLANYEYDMSFLPEQPKEQNANSTTESMPTMQ